MTLIPDDLVDVAYRKLKQMVYYDKTLLFLRKRMAEFECSDDFQRRIEEVANVIRTERAFENEKFLEWVGEIDFVLVPKSVRGLIQQQEGQGSFVSNVTSDKRYVVEKVNYLFDGPIELHLLAVLWLMTNGHKLDEQLVHNCFGSRLDSLVGEDDDHSANLFRKYHELYAQWRDNGIGKAADLLIKDNRSVCIIALDLQEFYYRVQVNWEAIWESTRRSIPIPPQLKGIFWRERLGENLLGCVKAICEAYQTRISPQLKVTHRHLPPESTCLPIGLCCSPVIANWQLRQFDKAILSEVRPAYYGRYVDDILIVVTNDSDPGNDPIDRFMKDVLVRTGVMRLNEEDQRYEVISSKGLFLQKEKCVLQYFEAGHSFAGLAKFRKKLQENASDFAMLPAEDEESPVEQVAYDLLYEGSANKLRSVKGIAEDRWDLAKHLSKRTQLQLLAAEGLDADTKRELFHFFRGRNAIDFWDMWERVISFFVAADDIADVDRFGEMVLEEVTKVRYTVSHADDEKDAGKGITLKLKSDLREHLGLSTEIARALRDSESSASRNWRRSNLIRHHLVAVPLLNYTTFDGDYVMPLASQTCELLPEKIRKSPRFVHFDECAGLVDSWFVERGDGDSITAANELYARFHGAKLSEVDSSLVNQQGAENA